MDHNILAATLSTFRRGQVIRLRSKLTGLVWTGEFVDYPGDVVRLECASSNRSPGDSRSVSLDANWVEVVR